MKCFNHNQGRLLRLLFVLLFYCNFSFAANWSIPPVNIIEAEHNLSCPKVVTDSFGRAIAVWESDSGANSIIKGAVLNPHMNVWISTSNLSLESEDACSPVIGVDQTGNVIAIWASSNIIRGAILPVGTLNWIPTTPLSDESVYSDYPSLSVNGKGKAIAVWESNLDGEMIIKSAVLNPDSYIWIQTQDLSHVNSLDPQVGIDAYGNAVAIWREVDEGLILKGATLTNGSLNWVPTNNLSFLDDQVFSFSLGVDNLGNAVAIWVKNIAKTLEGAKLLAGSQIWIPTNILSTVPSLSENPKVSLSPFGKAVAVWSNEDNDLSLIQGAILEPNSLTWISTSRLSQSGSLASNPQVAVDAYGNASAVWTFIENSNMFIQFAGLKSGNLVWDSRINLSNQGEVVDYPRIAVNNYNFLVAVWSNLTNANQFVQVINTVRMSPLLSSINTNKKIVIANGINEAIITVTIKDSNNLPMTGCHISLNENVGNSIISILNDITNEFGQACFSVKNSNQEIITYHAKDTTNNSLILQNVSIDFRKAEPPSPLPLPPRHFKGILVKNKLLNGTEIVHVLTWKPSIDPAVVGYFLYEGTKLIKKIPLKGPFKFEVHNRKKQRQYSYYIVSVNSNGYQSRSEKVILQ